MVRGLTVGINHSDVPEKPQITIDNLPRKGSHPKVVIDGVSLAYHFLTPESKDHSWDFLNGGNYKAYNDRTIGFIALLKSFSIDVVIVFPLADGTPPVTASATARWEQKSLEKMRRMARARNLVDKGAFTSRTLQELLPPFIVTEIADTAKAEGAEVIYTRNNVVRFTSKFVHDGHADAVIGQNSDYLIFKGVNYIPLDSIEVLEDVLNFDLLNDEIAAKLIKLEDPSRMFELSVILGNPFTEPFVVSKYNFIASLHIKLNPKYPDSLVVGVVNLLNNPEFDSVMTQSPTKEIIENDPEFQKAIEESKIFFDINSPLDPEGDSDIAKATLNGELPTWALGVFENGDFWYDPLVDDYEHQIKTFKVTCPLRKLCYSILKRKSVIEHIPKVDSFETAEIQAEAGFPDYAKLWSLKGKREKNLHSTYRNSSFALFPLDFPIPKDEPLDKIGEPFLTIGFALRYIISVCFTDNQLPNTLLPEDGPEELKKLKVVGAPPIDHFELQALAATALLLNQNILSKMSFPSFKPKLRRLKVAAYYQSALQHLFWLQQFLKIRDPKCSPHRLFDGDLFAALYECGGDILHPNFAGYFKDDKYYAKAERVAKELLPQFLDAVLSPFPANIFEAFSNCPRSIKNITIEDTKPAQTEVIVVQSAFAGLLDSDDEDNEDNEAPVEEVKAAPPPPPPPVAAPPPKRQQKKKRNDDEDDEDLEAFLIAQAKKNAELGGAPQPKVQAKPPPKKKKPHVRKLEGGMTMNNAQGFTKESKQELKRQLKQQGFDYN